MKYQQIRFIYFFVFFIVSHFCALIDGAQYSNHKRKRSQEDATYINDIWDQSELILYEFTCDNKLAPIRLELEKNNSQAPVVQNNSIPSIKKEEQEAITLNNKFMNQLAPFGMKQEKINFEELIIQNNPIPLDTKKIVQKICRQPVLEPKIMEEYNAWFRRYCGTAQVLMENIEKEFFWIGNNDTQSHISDYFAKHLEYWTFWTRSHLNHQKNNRIVSIKTSSHAPETLIRNPLIPIKNKLIFPYITQNRWKDTEWPFMLICIYKLQNQGTPCRGHSPSTSAENRLEDYFEKRCLVANETLSVLRTAAKNLMPLCPQCAKNILEHFKKQ